MPLNRPCLSYSLTQHRRPGPTPNLRPPNLSGPGPSQLRVASDPGRFSIRKLMVMEIGDFP
ncbi:hypothetical protein CCMA1212_003234 [Trichoderma ghanense]|uniref:Uncharacterized protein n=1 Tax=Trichoderma ghanense TaxID=65468 RepID=A0ABY2HA02_9HYPO